MALWQAWEQGFPTSHSFSSAKHNHTSPYMDKNIATVGTDFKEPHHHLRLDQVFSVKVLQLDKLLNSLKFCLTYNRLPASLHHNVVQSSKICCNECYLNSRALLTPEWIPEDTGYCDLLESYKHFIVKFRLHLRQKHVEKRKRLDVNSLINNQAQQRKNTESKLSR